MRRLRLVLMLFCLTSCAKKVNTPTSELKGDGWYAVEGSEGNFLVIAIDESEDAAYKAVCPKEYICAHRPVGTVTEIGRIKK